jgi:hypothetical protein
MKIIGLLALIALALMVFGDDVKQTPPPDVHHYEYQPTEDFP